MTAIAAIVDDEGTVYMGGDSAGVSDLHVSVRKDPKVFKNGLFIMGFTSSFRMGQLLHYAFTPPEHPKNIGVDRYMNTIFIDAIRDCLIEGGYAEIKSNREHGGTFIVGYKGRIFEIADDFQVGFPATSYTAIGCGYELCLGSLHSTEKIKADAKTRIKMALKAAEAFSGGVRGPFVIQSLKKEK